MRSKRLLTRANPQAGIRCLQRPSTRCPPAAHAGTLAASQKDDVPDMSINAETTRTEVPEGIRGLLSRLEVPPSPSKRGMLSPQKEQPLATPLLIPTFLHHRRRTRNRSRRLTLYQALPTPWRCRVVSLCYLSPNPLPLSSTAPLWVGFEQTG